MNPPPPSHTRDRFARVRSLLHWRVLAPVLGGAVMPKCLLCAAAYTAGGAALFGTRPELCGEAGGSDAVAFLAPLAGAMIGAAFAVWRQVRRPHASPRRRALD